MSIFDIFKPQEESQYVISQEAFPCPEHHGEHMIERAIAQNEDTFISVTKCGNSYDSVVCQDMNEPVRHYETLHSNLDNTVDWLCRLLGG